MNKIHVSLAALLISGSIASANEVPLVTSGGTKVSIYGRLELNASYEDGATSAMWSANAASPARGPEGDKIDPQGRTTLSIARTRLGLNLSGSSKEDEPDLRGRFEVDFAGNSNYNNFNGSSGLRIRQSWGSVNYKNLGLTLLFGMTDDLILPLDPPAVHPTAFNGVSNVGSRRPQIRITQAIGPTEVAVAATHDHLRVADNVASSSPALQARAGLKLPASWAGEKANWALGVGYLFAKDEAANADNDKRNPRGPETSLIGIDLSLPLLVNLALTGEWFMGQNLSRYGNGSLGLDHTTESNPDKVKADGIKSMGWWCALSAKLPAKISAASGIGMENLDESTVIPGSRKNNMFVFANLGYNFTSAAVVTFEWVTLATDYADRIGLDDSGSVQNTKVDSGNLNRYEVNFRYNFR
ncbi:MAG: hypothetical protein LBC85_01785 [Fibromonadaceae bacterium]|jgi:hypothetical protein|nr:hypothetical protein [Fibromonadaceae bacterium]